MSDPLPPACRTRFCDLVGCRVPVVQTGMGWVSGANLTAATSAAGGFGILAAVTMTPEEMRAAVRGVKERTDAPFGVNFRADQPDLDERVAFVVGEGVRLVSFAGAPTKDAVARCHDAGVVVMPTVGARRHAEKVLEMGVDAVIAQGGEGGGHTGSVPTSLLLPQVVDAVGASVPVLGAGGFHDGRGLVAALAYGADGIAMGTRFLLTQESHVPAVVKDRYTAASVFDTVVTTAIDGAPQRVIRTDVVDRIERSPRVLRFPRAALAALRFRKETGTSLRDLLAEGLAMRRNQDLTLSQLALAANAPMLIKATMVDGKPEVGILPTGQVTGVIDELPTVAELLDRIVTDAEAALERLGGLTGVDLTWSADEDSFRADARAWLEANLAAWRASVGGEPASGDTRDGFAQHLEWERRLFADRWAVVSWAPEHGGRGASLWEWLLFEEEYYRAGGPPRITQNGIFLLAPSIYEFGTDEQRDGILPRMAAADDLWCQGWSEPNAGSDLASVTSRAQRVEGGWLLNGQKTWTTRGAFCTHLFGLFRTDPDSARHKGLTYLLVPLDGPGITVRGFGRLDGDEGFAEVFFDDALLPDDAVPGGVVLGEPEGGWAVAMATAGSERGLTLRSPGRFLATAERLLQLAAGRDDTELRRRAACAWMHADAYQQHTLATVTKLAAGAKAGAEASLTKLWWSELDIELHEIALDLLGPDAELEGPWSKGWQFSLSGPIYAGTNEIQRNIAAERLLGLPR